MAFTYTRQITDEEEKILKDSLLDPIKWFDGMIDGKLNNCVGHGAKRRKEELIKKGRKTIPATDVELLKDAFVDPDYKDREARDLEEALKKKGDK